MATATQYIHMARLYSKLGGICNQWCAGLRHVTVAVFVQKLHLLRKQWLAHKCHFTHLPPEAT
jgi:hypothetical protein